MPIDVETEIRRFTTELRNWQSAPVSVEKTLAELLYVTESRAVGLWRIEGDALRLVGFAAQPDMPKDVQQGFADATQKVPLSQTGLGIVKAVIQRGPAVAHVEPGSGGLADSASWLARFEAVQSLAVPIGEGENVWGVLAMSTANPLVENDDTWQLLTGIAARLSGD